MECRLVEYASVSGVYPENIETTEEKVGYVLLVIVGQPLHIKV